MPYKNIEDNRKWNRENWKRMFDGKPWVKVIRSIRSRCCKNRKYFNRGIKNFLTTADIKMLWFRDKAYEISNPSIDRIDGFGSYTIENCRFLELNTNLRRKKCRR